MPCSPSWATTARASPPCAGKAPSERYAEPFIGAPRTERPPLPLSSKGEGVIRTLPRAWRHPARAAAPTRTFGLTARCATRRRTRRR
ncbi:hypothetical protein AO961_32585 [Pseudomonas aeruginosa]|nr:hypothetical protein [Pseudomonas aeruginosa]OPD88409.1 hypothetical protein AO961_32585 [Pseudomonas aeruginosa]HBP4736914.1 hypothetical protein [Pseudomonas aeruginosa]